MIKRSVLAMLEGQMNQHDLEQLEGLQRSADWSACVLKAKAMLNQQQDLPEVWMVLGVAYVGMNQLPQAIDALQKALTLEPHNPRIHVSLANTYKKTKQYEKARLHYQQALKFDPNYVHAAHNLAGLYGLEGDYPKALKAYRDAIHLAPDFLPSHYHLGLLLLQHQQWQAAEKQFRNVLALDAEHAQAHFYLGILKLQAELWDDAEVCFFRALEFKPEYVDAWVNLGVVALKQGHEQQAIAHFTQALLLDEHHLEARNNMAATFIHFDRYENALKYYDELLKEYPHEIEYLYNAGVAQMGLGHVQEATQLFHLVLVRDELHFGALSNLAAIRLRLGDKQQAKDLLRRALWVRPGDKTSRFMLDALEQNQLRQDACPDYVADLFNHYALYYDKHMQTELGYALPQKLWSYLSLHSAKPFSKALDLGCGTGLTGMVLRPLCVDLTGIDIAAKMVALAEEKKIYDRLITSEIVGFLKQDQAQYDLVVAMDVLPYLGDLSVLFETLKMRMMPTGKFCFSTEISSDAPWSLQSNMRFCHHPDYVKELAVLHGFKLEHQETMVARLQAGEGVKVIFYVFT